MHITHSHGTNREQTMIELGYGTKREQPIDVLTFLSGLWQTTGTVD
jgi:hypothetical protein